MAQRDLLHLELRLLRLNTFSGYAGSAKGAAGIGAGHGSTQTSDQCLPVLCLCTFGLQWWSGALQLLLPGTEALHVSQKKRSFPIMYSTGFVYEDIW